jgi:hypothetical protein
MNEILNKHNNTYQNLLSSISDTIAHGRQKAVLAVNSTMVDTYWKIGQYIVEFEQGGDARAEYGSTLLASLSKDLTNNLGKGFSLSNVKRMRQLYKTYPISAELPHQLSWMTHFALHNISSQLFVNKYQLYLPNKEELKQALEYELSKNIKSNITHQKS